MPKTLLGISILLMTLALVFGLLNTNKVKSLRNEIATAKSERDTANRMHNANEKKFKAEAKELSDAKVKEVDAEAKLQSAEADLSKAQTEKAESQSKLQANETQIADLQKQIADVTSGGAAPGGAPGAPNDAQAALEDAKKQLDAAEQEKSLLGEKVKAAQDQVAALREEKKRRDAGSNTPGVHGTVLAVNQAYNFVVPGIGERQGVVANSEMLVLRAGSLIGKIGFPQLNRRPPSAISLPAACHVAWRYNLETLSFMLGLRILKVARPHCLTIAFLAAAAAGGFSSCASQKAAPTLVSDPDAHGESSVPWNRPANWEGKGDIPGGLSPSGSGQDPFGQSGSGGTGGY